MLLQKSQQVMCNFSPLLVSNSPLPTGRQATLSYQERVFFASLVRIELTHLASEASALSTELQGLFESFASFCYNISIPMQRILTLIICLFLLTFSFSLAFAQENEDVPEEQAEIVDETTDTETPLDDSSETGINTVPGSPEEFLEIQTEDAAETPTTQTDNAEDDEEEAEPSTFGASTHELTFEYDARVVVTNTMTGVAFLEIDYTVKLEEPIEVSERRKQTTGKANIMTNVVGVLGSNDLFTCELDVEISDADVSISAKQITTYNEYNDPTDTQLTLQLNFSKSDLLEDWFSYCSAVDGSRLNTQGDQEKYLYEILKSTQPGLDSLIIDDFDPDDHAYLNLFTEEIIQDDFYGDEEFSLSGSGRVDIEPIEQD